MITALSAPKVETQTSAATRAEPARARPGAPPRRPRPAATPRCARSGARGGRRRWRAGRSRRRRACRPRAREAGRGRGSRTSPERQVTSCQPLYAQSTVTTPSPNPLQRRRLERARPRPTRRRPARRAANAAAVSARIAATLATVETFWMAAPKRTERYCAAASSTISAAATRPHLVRRQRHQPAQVLGEDERDRAGAGGNDDEVQPAEQEGGERAVRLAQVDVHPARAGEQAPPPPPARARRTARRCRPRPRPAAWPRRCRSAAAAAAGTRKMPLPIMMPTVTAAVDQGPIRRGSLPSAPGAGDRARSSSVDWPIYRFRPARTGSSGAESVIERSEYRLAEVPVTGCHRSMFRREPRAKLPAARCSQVTVEPRRPPAGALARQTDPFDRWMSAMPGGSRMEPRCGGRTPDRPGDWTP